MILESAALCLALNVFYEARSEFIPGQYAVAAVTMNRAKGDQRKVCDVVFKPKQFSWANGVQRTKNAWVIPSVTLRAAQSDPEAWALAWHVARWTLAGKIPDITQGAEFYHTKAVKPIWRHQLTPTKTMGQHRFYAAAKPADAVSQY